MRVRSAIRGRVWSAVFTAALVVPMLAVGQPAQAIGDGNALEGASTTGGVQRLAPVVSAAAWQAGRQQYGAGVSADEAIRAYWTPERMRAAAPVDESPAYQEAVREYDRSLRKAGPAKAERGAPLVVPPAEGEMGTPLAPTAINPNLPFNHPTARTSGKVFFTMDGRNWQCSGMIVNSSGGNTVWTAGHCLHGGQGGTLATSWAFVPAYDDDLANPRPYGTWTARGLYTMTSWINNSDWSSDMGVAIMNTLNGNRIVHQFGGQGLRANQGFNVGINAFGYPAEPPFDGGNLWRCASGTSQESSQTIRISCDFNRGASGGGWLLSWNGNWGYLNGVNSRADLSTWVASPYFDNTAVVLYDFTAPL